MDEEPQAETTSPLNRGSFAHDRERAIEAGRRGGQHSRGGGGASNNSGNFANNRQRAVEAGRKGGSRRPGTAASKH
jgi:uncharacterized protein